MEDELHNGEHPYRHCPGGLHPVHIDDRLEGDRYKILHRLGFGDFSTAWLARDRFLQKYVASKIKEAGISKFYNELKYTPRPKYIMQGVAYLHSEGIYHGDLPAENVLFSAWKL